MAGERAQHLFFILYNIRLVSVRKDQSGDGSGKNFHPAPVCHIYDRHIPIVKELIERPTFDAPSVWLDKVDNFYDFKIDNIHINNYQHNSQIKFPVAI